MIQHLQYEGKWIAVVANDKLDAGQLSIHYMPGLGEVDTTATEAGLLKIEKQGAIKAPAGQDDFTNKTLYGVADYHKVNILTTAPKNQYQYGEIPALIHYADQVLKSGQKAALCQSLGGFGMAAEVGKDPELPKQFDCIIMMATGPGTRTNTAKHFAESKTPVWFIVCEGDDYAGTHDEVTYDLHREIKRLGGISFLTVFQKGSFKDPHVIFGVLMNQWDKFTTKPFSPLNEVVPTMSIYQWMLSQKKGTPVIPPNGKWERKDIKVEAPVPVPSPPPVEQPAPAPIPAPPVQEPEPVVEAPQPAEKAYLRGAYSNPDPRKPGSDMVTILWSDSEEGEVIKAGEGEKITGVYTRLLINTGNRMFKASIKYQRDKETWQKDFGPYKQ